MSTLLIARHGNTFDPGDTVLRVGKRTDLPLSNSGREQAKKLGEFLNDKHPKIDHIFVSSLKRTQETASIALPGHAYEINPIFDEIDYGIDDGKPETAVVARLGEQSLKQWEERAIPPVGWHVNPEKIIQDWMDFAKNCIENTTTLVVTSNGIARFASYILGGAPTLSKMRTGAISGLSYTDNAWKLDFWDVRPD